MILPWLVGSSPLSLEEDASSGVLLPFPPASRCLFALHVADFLLRSTNRSAAQQTRLLPTPTHLKVVLECVGQAFDLPIAPYAALDTVAAWQTDAVDAEADVDERHATMVPLSSSSGSQQGFLGAARRDDSFRGDSGEPAAAAAAAAAGPPTDVVVAAATELYRRWLLEPKERPAVIAENEQEIYQTIFRHFSMLFAPRATMGTDVDTHAQLCMTVLQVLESVGRSRTLSKESWHDLLRVMVGITDSLLKGGRGGADQASPLAQRLCPLLLRVLSELLLRSETDDTEYWDELKERMLGWRHRKDAVISWANVCMALGRHVIRLLYGPSEGTEGVDLESRGGASTSSKAATVLGGESAGATGVKVAPASTSHTLILDPAYAIQAWQRMMHLLGDPETMVDPANYVEVMRSIRQQVGTFLAVGAMKAAKPSPDGNRIFDIFGGWIFGALVGQSREAFDEGVGEALKTAVAVFTKKHGMTAGYGSDHPNPGWNPTYLTSFYIGFDMVIHRSTYLLCEAIVTAPSLFALDLPGIMSVVPALVHACGVVLTATAGSSRVKLPKNYQTPRLRAAAVEVIAQLVALPNRFRLKGAARSVTFPALLPAGSRGSAPKSFDDVFIILEQKLLIPALKSEDVPANLDRLMWLCVSFVFENLNREPENDSDKFEFARQVVSYILDHIVDPSSRFTMGNALTGLRALGALAAAAPSFSRPGHVTLASREVVPKLIEFVENRVLASALNKSEESHVTGAAEKAAKRKENEHIANVTVLAFEVLQRWCFVPSVTSHGKGNSPQPHWLLHDKAILTKIVDTCLLASTGSSPRRPSGIADPHATAHISDKGKKRGGVFGGGSHQAAQQQQHAALLAVQAGARPLLAPRTIGAAAAAVLVRLLHLDAFPRGSGPFIDDTGSHVTLLEEKMMSKLGVTDESITCIVHDETILTIIEHPPKKNVSPARPTVTIVSRTAAGTFIWECVQQQAESTPQLNAQAISDYSGDTPNIAKEHQESHKQKQSAESAMTSTGAAASMAAGARMSANLNAEDALFYDQLVDLLEPSERRRLQSIGHQANLRHQEERKLLEECNYGLSVNIAARQPTPILEALGSRSVSPVSQQVVPIAARLWMAHWGLLDEDIKPMVVHAGASFQQRIQAVAAGKKMPPSFNTVAPLLSALDAMPVREQYRCAAVLLLPAQSSLAEVLSNEHGKPSTLPPTLPKNLVARAARGQRLFETIVAGMGRPTAVASHRGYKGGLKRNNPGHGQTFPYFATATHEIAFLVSTLMAQSGGKEGPGGTNPLGVTQKVLSGTEILVTFVADPPAEFCNGALAPSAAALTSPCTLPWTPRVHFVVLPTDAGNLRVRVFCAATENLAALSVGPVFDGGTFSPHAFPAALRETIVAVSSVVEADSGGDSNKAESRVRQRRRMIRKMIHQWHEHSKDAYHESLASTFVT